MLFHVRTKVMTTGLVELSETNYQSFFSKRLCTEKLSKK